MPSLRPGPDTDPAELAWGGRGAPLPDSWGAWGWLVALCAALLQVRWDGLGSAVPCCAALCPAVLCCALLCCAVCCALLGCAVSYRTLNCFLAVAGHAQEEDGSEGGTSRLGGVLAAAHLAVGKVGSIFESWCQCSIGAQLACKKEQTSTRNCACCQMCSKQE